MANLFKVVTNATMPGTAGTSAALYTVQSDKAIIVLGLVLANVHTSQVTASVTLVSTVNQTGAAQNGTSFIVKDVAIPAGSSLSVVDGKIVANATDVIRVDCSVADKVSATLSYMEQDV